MSSTSPDLNYTLVGRRSTLTKPLVEVERRLPSFLQELADEIL